MAQVYESRTHLSTRFCFTVVCQSGQMADPPHLQVVVMGVSGSGKSTVGELLARRVGLDYADADDFHTDEAIEKMSAGEPLTHEDREPWLDAIGRWLADHQDVGAVATCSALKRRYRDVLRRHAPGAWFLFVDGSEDLIRERMGQRSKHFMPRSLLTSQLAALEPPEPDEQAITADAADSPDAIVAKFVQCAAREEEEAFQRLYGLWDPLTPAEAKEVFDATGLTWWVAGGYAVEAFSGLRRHHEDIDVSIFRRDVAALTEALAGRFHVWAAGSEGLCPLNDPDKSLSDWADQVWIRAHALAPWRADVLLNPDRDREWVSRRDTAFAAPLDQVTWEREGIRYLNPEIALAFKAKLARPKDNLDFHAVLPLLSDKARGWLGDYLARKEPQHPWRAEL